MFFEVVTPAPAAVEPAPLRVRRSWLLPGDLGVHQTLSSMRLMVKEADADPNVKEAAVQLTHGAAPMDYEGHVQLLRRRLPAAFRYVSDGRDREEVWGPDVHARRYLTTGSTFGDCDDLAVFQASLVRAVGIPARFVALANGRRGLKLNHVRTEAMVAPGRWQSLDHLAPRTPILRVTRLEV